MWIDSRNLKTKCHSSITDFRRYHSFLTSRDLRRVAGESIHGEPVECGLISKLELTSMERRERLRGIGWMDDQIFKSCFLNIHIHRHSIGKNFLSVLSKLLNKIALRTVIE